MQPTRRLLGQRGLPDPSGPDQRHQPRRPHQQRTKPIQLALTTHKPTPNRWQTSRVTRRRYPLPRNNFPLGIPTHNHASQNLACAAGRAIPRAQTPIPNQQIQGRASNERKINADLNTMVTDFALGGTEY
jgi:hypothetical protein